MQEIKVKIEGIAPLLFNRLTDPDALKTKGRSTPTESEKQAEAKAKVYRDEDGNMGIPADAIKKCLREGCRSAGLKLGKKSAEPLLRALVHVDNRMIVPFYPTKTEPDGYHEASARIPPRTGARVMKIWPYCKAGWKMEFTLLVIDEQRISSNLLRRAMDEAGLCCGLCDHRPEYGRFKVVEWA